jgi:hypothetical protein
VKKEVFYGRCAQQYVGLTASIQRLQLCMLTCCSELTHQDCLRLHRRGYMDSCLGLKRQ